MAKRAFLQSDATHQQVSKRHKVFSQQLKNFEGRMAAIEAEMAALAGVVQAAVARMTSALGGLEELTEVVLDEEPAQGSIIDLTDVPPTRKKGGRRGNGE